MTKNVINQLLNLFWTSLCFAPIVWYWYQNKLDFWWYLFLAMALTSLFLSKKTLEKLTFFKRRRQYEKWQVKSVRWLAQNGTFANRFGKEKERDLQIKNIIQAKRYLKTIAMYERYHWMCLIFFLFTSIHALVAGKLLLSLLTMMANAIYNLASILLQQYNKMRIMILIARQG
jgi:hypothetical protein